MSSSSTLFIALQCCQCSTMQVKQKKKSSNKWSCAVCNQKQSVRKVFAQGYMAKDIRIFVQNFNMSRKSLEDNQQQWLLAGTLDPTPEHADGNSNLPANQKKTRSDWTAYLDQDNHHATNGGEQAQHGSFFNSIMQYGDEFEPLVVTELPKGMFKKRRLVDNSTAGSDRHFERPLFPNSQDADEPIKDQRRITLLTASNSERNKKVTLTPDNQRTQKCNQTISRAASKWNDYLTEDNDNLEFGWKRGFNFTNPSGSRNSSILEAIASEQSVEDDIHPDFL